MYILMGNVLKLPCKLVSLIKVNNDNLFLVLAVNLGGNIQNCDRLCRT